MGRKRRRKPASRSKVRPPTAPATSSPPPQPEAPQQWVPRLWLILGAAGLFISGSLIGAVVGTQVARQEFAAQQLQAVTAPRAPSTLPGFQRRGPSQHALNVFQSDPAEEPRPPAETAPSKSGAAPAPSRPAQAPEPEVAAAKAEPEPAKREAVVPAPEPKTSEKPEARETQSEAEVALATPRHAGTPTWERHAVEVAAATGQPTIAIVIDDLGLNLPNTRRTIKLPAPLSLAFMTYGYDLQRLTRSAAQAGHELLVHVPMEPLDSSSDPGPNVLRTGLTQSELEQRLDWGLTRFEGYVGVNNHMGSRFTSSRPDMARVLRALKERGLLFLDSQTIAESVGGALADDLGVPYALRDIFIDNDPDPESIAGQLAKLERLSRRRGYAVGIGHPHSATIAVLDNWIPAARSRGFVFVPISHIVRRRNADG